ncbi:helix-turn-helix domain-containing protein [Streptomyces sp. SS]|uniref:helix-turn-helix domain-containing protein n=1 Tax=Streptomyces sp. SS TaxID=260742 RepID=UPI000301ADD4|nr:helix-turn-helix domain-containing protein [Streptomyces sp. SS]
MSSSTAQERARPVRRRGMERGRAILDAAGALLGEQGYDAATLKAIGERAGIPIASVHHRFPTAVRSTPHFRSATWRSSTG